MTSGAVADRFAGVAVTRGGQVWSGALGELRQVAKRRPRARARAAKPPRGADRAAPSGADARAESAPHARAPSPRRRLRRGAARRSIERRERAEATAALATTVPIRYDALEAERRVRRGLIEQRRVRSRAGRGRSWCAARCARGRARRRAARRLERVERDRAAPAPSGIAALRDHAGRPRRGASPRRSRASPRPWSSLRLARSVESLLASIEEELRADNCAAGEAFGCGAAQIARAPRKRAAEGSFASVADADARACEVARAQQARTRQPRPRVRARGLLAAAARGARGAAGQAEELLEGEGAPRRCASAPSGWRAVRELLGPVNPLAAEEYREEL